MVVTLIAVYNSSGCVGRCDARCYNAHEATCECICGGANHGVGLGHAQDQTQDGVEGWLERYAEDHDFTEAEVPALYAMKTDTARKIARLVNEYYGQNVVKNVERLTDGQGKRLWRIWVNQNKVSGTSFHEFRSLTEARQWHKIAVTVTRKEPVSHA